MEISCDGIIPASSSSCDVSFGSAGDMVRIRTWDAAIELFVFASGFAPPLAKHER